MARTTRNSTAAEEPRDIAALIEERDKYRDWLRALLDQRDEMPEHVYARVESDYRERLKEVYRELRLRLQGIEEAYGERQMELREARDRLRAKVDEQAEAEVRFRVGEFGKEEWKALQATFKRQIDRADAETRGLEDEVARLGETLRDIGAITDEVEQFDDAAFVRSLVEDADRRDQDSDRRRGGKKGRTARPKSKEPAAAAGAPPARAKPQPPPPAEPTPAPPPPAAAQPHPSAPPSAAQLPVAAVPPPPPDEPKPRRTLECATCGMFNVPGTRYCEACGAKLPRG